MSFIYLVNKQRGGTPIAVKRANYDNSKQYYRRWREATIEEKIRYNLATLDEVKAAGFEVEEIKEDEKIEEKKTTKKTRKSSKKEKESPKEGIK